MTIVISEEDHLMYDQSNGTWKTSDPPSGGSFYSTGRFASQVMPFTLVRPAPASAVVGIYSADHYGYVGRETQIQLVAQGGAFPYVAVVDDAPSGYQLSNDPTSPDYLVLKFTPSANGTFPIVVRLYDANGANLININYTFTVSTDWCVFCDPTGVDSAGRGSFASPFKTIHYARNNTTGGKALILKNGTYTDTQMGISFGSGAINSLLAWERRQAIIDMSANVQTTPNILFYINNAHTLIQGIHFRNPMNQVNNPRWFSGSAVTDYVFQDDCRFEINGRSGTVNDDNVSCFFLGDTGGTSRRFVAQTRCSFDGLVGLSNGWSTFDFYTTRYWVCMNNEYSNQISAGTSAGVLWPKGRNVRDGDIKLNTFTSAYGGGVIDAYLGNDAFENNVTGNLDICFNLIRSNGQFGLWVGRTDSAGTRLPVWSRRNTYINAIIMIFNRSFPVTFTSDSDVIQSTISSTDPWKVVIRDSNDPENVYRPLSFNPNLTATITNYDCHANSGVVDSNGILTGSYAAQRGLRGHEVINV